MTKTAKQLELERDQLLEELRQLRANESAIALAVGVLEIDPECGPIGPGEPADILAEVRRLVQSEKELRTRLAEPPSCWHCHDLLIPEREHCENCPPICEDQDCKICGGVDLR